eukprot:jgi/Tetstr1/428309/TSEL_018345.t1
MPASFDIHVAAGARVCAGGAEACAALAEALLSRGVSTTPEDPSGSPFGGVNAAAACLLLITRGYQDRLAADAFAAAAAATGSGRGQPPGTTLLEFALMRKKHPTTLLLGVLEPGMLDRSTWRGPLSHVARMGECLDLTHLTDASLDALHDAVRRVVPRCQDAAAPAASTPVAQVASFSLGEVEEDGESPEKSQAEAGRLVMPARSQTEAEDDARGSPASPPAVPPLRITQAHVPLAPATEPQRPPPEKPQLTPVSFSSSSSGKAHWSSKLPSRPEENPSVKAVRPFQPHDQLSSHSVRRTSDDSMSVSSGSSEMLADEDRAPRTMARELTQAVSVRFDEHLSFTGAPSHLSVMTARQQGDSASDTVDTKLMEQAKAALEAAAADGSGVPLRHVLHACRIVHSQSAQMGLHDREAAGPRLLQLLQRALVRHGGADPGVAEHAAGAVVNLTRHSDKMKEATGHTGLVAQLAYVLGKHGPAHRGVAKQACTALWNLATVPSLVHEAGHLGLFDTLSPLLHAHCGRPTVLERACGMLRALLRAPGGEALVPEAAHLLPDLQLLLREAAAAGSMGGTDESMEAQAAAVEQAAGTVALLCANEDDVSVAEEAGRLGLLAEVQAVLATYAESFPGVAEQGASAVRAICGPVKGNRALAFRLGLPVELVNVLRAHARTRSRVTTKAAGALWSLCLYGPAKDAAGAAGALTELQAALIALGSDVSVAERCAGAIWALCDAHPANRAEAFRLGLLADLSEALQRHGLDSATRSASMSAAIAAVVGTEKEAKTAAGEAGLLALLQEVLKRHGRESPDTAGHASHALMSICALHTGNRSEAGRLGLVGDLVELLRVPIVVADRDAAALSSGALWALCDGNVANKAAAGRLGAVPVLQALLRSPLADDHERVAEMACSALFAVCSNASNKAEAGKAGLLADLQAILRRHGRDSKDVSGQALGAIYTLCHGNADNLEEAKRLRLQKELLALWSAHPRARAVQKYSKGIERQLGGGEAMLMSSFRGLMSSPSRGNA